MKKKLILLCLISSLFSISSCNKGIQGEESDVIVEDLIGRSVCVNPGNYKRVVCIGAGALRLYSYVGDINLVCAVEDIDNYTLESRPKMFDQAPRPYFMANKEYFSTLPSCGVGGPQAQSAEAEKILSCNPDIVVSEYSDVDSANSLQEKLGVPVITLSYGNKGVFDENITKSLTLLGNVFDRKTKSQSLIDYINNEKENISEVSEKASQEATETKNVYICGLGNWGTTNYLMTAQNYEPFNVAHINNAVSGLSKDGIGSIEKEKFESIAENIDVMIIDAAALNNISSQYSEDNTIFDTCKAYQNGEVYIEMPYNAYYTNLEIALINTWYYVKVIYGDAVEKEMNTIIDEVCTQFLGKELSSELYNFTTTKYAYQKVNLKEIL